MARRLTMKDMHTCGAFRCGTICPKKHLMCPKHWDMVPASLQDGIYAHYKRGRGVRDASPNYRTVMLAALFLVAKKEKVPVPSSADATIREAEEILGCDLVVVDSGAPPTAPASLKGGVTITQPVLEDEITDEEEDEPEEEEPTEDDEPEED